MSISICTLSHGGKYSSFLIPWAKSISKLEVVPDEIIIAHDNNVTANQIDEVNDLLIPRPTWIPLDENVSWEYSLPVLFNHAIRAATSEWIVRCDIDDYYYPSMLNEVNECQEDILVFNWEKQNGDLVDVDANFANVFKQCIFPPCCPFRKWIWERKNIQDLPSEDWIFWAYAYKHGAKIKKVDKVGYRYYWRSDGVCALKTRKQHKLVQSQIRFIEKRYTI